MSGAGCDVHERALLYNIGLGYIYEAYQDPFNDVSEFESLVVQLVNQDVNIPTMKTVVDDASSVDGAVEQGKEKLVVLNTLNETSSDYVVELDMLANAVSIKETAVTHRDSIGPKVAAGLLEAAACVSLVDEVYESSPDRLALMLSDENSLLERVVKLIDRSANNILPKESSRVHFEWCAVFERMPSVDIWGVMPVCRDSYYAGLFVLRRKLEQRLMRLTAENSRIKKLKGCPIVVDIAKYVGDTITRDELFYISLYGRFMPRLTPEIVDVMLRWCRNINVRRSEVISAIVEAYTPMGSGVDIGYATVYEYMFFSIRRMKKMSLFGQSIEERQRKRRNDYLYRRVNRIRNFQVDEAIIAYSQALAVAQSDDIGDIERQYLQDLMDDGDVEGNPGPCVPGLLIVYVVIYIVVVLLVYAPWNKWFGEVYDII